MTHRAHDDAGGGGRHGGGPARPVVDPLDLGILREIPRPPDSPLRFALTWDNRQEPSPADLDLGCLYVIDDDRRGVVQPVRGIEPGAPELRTAVGVDGEPVIVLGADDRGGTATGGETLSVLQPRRVRFLVLFVSIYGGSRDFTEVGAVVTAQSDHRVEAVSRLSSPPPNLRFCSVLTLGRHGGANRLRHEERYFRSAYHADRHYGFGLRWRIGVKPPSPRPNSSDR